MRKQNSSKATVQHMPFTDDTQAPAGAEQQARRATEAAPL